QTVTATLEGLVTDASAAVVEGAAVTAVGAATGFTRTESTELAGQYHIFSLPAGEYAVTVEKSGFKKETKKVILTVGALARLDFVLAVGEASQEVSVAAASEAVEPTRTAVSTVINQVQIASLPVNGRQFIDFALLAPGITVGETTAGSTDVIVE